MTKGTIALSLSLAAAAWACGGDGGNGKSEPSKDAQVGLSAGPWEPESCSPQAQAQSFPSPCKQADFDTWNACVVAACQPTYDICFGAGRSTGDFSGACAPYAECALDCKCSDSDCTNKCPGAQECADCYSAHPCGGTCTEPACALAGTGIDGGKTCADLKRCCAGLSDAASAKQCTSSARMLDVVPGGDYSCAALYKTFQALSSTCD